jgi:TolB-like protein
MELLRESSSTIAEIAFETGFNSVTYFNKCFNDHYGYPPGVANNSSHEIEILEQPKQQNEKKGIGKKKISVIYFIVVLSILLLVTIIFIVWKPFKDAVEPKDKSIAVLPFINDSPEETEMYFINGTMEAILINLGKIEDLRVVSRNSVEQYRNNPKPTLVVAEEMNVTYVLEGSGHRDGDMVRLFVQLIDATKDQHIWSKSYDANIEEIFTLQSEIAQMVAGEIEVIITPEEMALIEKIPTTNQTAYDLYLKARAIADWNSSNDDIEQSIELLRYSIEYDPTFAAPLVSMGTLYQALLNRNPVDNHNYLDSVIVYSNRAISLDDKNDGAYRLKGDCYIRTNDMRKAVDQYNKAIELYPNQPWAYGSMGWLYFRQNDFPQSIKNFYKSVQLNRGEELPRGLKALGLAYNQTGFHKKFKEILKQAWLLDGDTVDFYNWYSFADLTAGNFAEALESAHKVYEIDTSDLYNLSYLMLIHHFINQNNMALKYCNLYIDKMEDLGQFIPYFMPWVIYTLSQAGNDKRASFYQEKLIRYYQDGHSESNQLDQLLALVLISAMNGESEKMYNYLADINRQEKLYVWVNSLRVDPIFSDRIEEHEFLDIIGEIEKKFELQVEQNRLFLEENNML